MIFNNHRQSKLLSAIGQCSDAIRAAFHLLFTRAFTARIDANGKATERLRRVQPAHMALDRVATRGGINGAQVTLAVNHDENAAHAFAVTPRA